MTYSDDVFYFNRKLGLPHRAPDVEPHFLDRELQARRDEFLNEELIELEEAILAGDLPKAADAIADAVYVLLGTAEMMALPMSEIWYAVHCANMKKERAAEGDTSGGADRPHALGVTKPPGWKAPDVATILERAGWNRRFKDSLKAVRGG